MQVMLTAVLLITLIFYVNPKSPEATEEGIRSAGLYQLWSQFRVLVNGTTLHSNARKDNTKRNNYAGKFSTPTTTYYIW